MIQFWECLQAFPLSLLIALLESYLQISGSFYKLTTKQGSDSIAQQKALFVPSTLNPFLTQWPGDACYKHPVSPLCHKNSAPPAPTAFYLIRSLRYRASPNIQLGLRILLPQVHTILKKKVQSKVTCSLTVISRYSFYLKFTILPQKEANLPSFLCPVITAICQASILVQSNRSTVKQGFYNPHLQGGGKKTQNKTITTHLLEDQIGWNV